MLLNHFLLLRVNIKYDWREMVSANIFVPQTVLRDYPPSVGCRKNSSLNLAWIFRQSGMLLLLRLPPLIHLLSPLSKLSFSDKKNNTVLSPLSFCLGYQEAWPNFESMVSVSLGLCVLSCSVLSFLGMSPVFLLHHF